MRFLNEYRSVLFALFIIVIVNLIAFVSFKKTNSVSNKISQTITTSVPPSIVARQMFIELRSAENHARTYYLTEEFENLRDFYKTTYLIQWYHAQLGKFRGEFKEDAYIIDTIIALSKACINDLKRQSNSNAPKKIIGELDELSNKIDELYARYPSLKNDADVALNEDTLQARQGFLKRLFSRKKQSKDSTRSKVSSPPKIDPTSSIVKGKLITAVNAAKSSQSKIIQETRKAEYELAKSFFVSRERINALIDTLSLHEERRRIGNSKTANDELSKLKTFTIVSTFLLSLFLLALIFFIYMYIRKKIEFAKMLIGARNEAERLAKAKENFLSDMSHEIRTPLNSIYGFSELLLNSPLNSEQKTQVNIIRNSSGYLAKLINSILMNSRLNSGKMDLNETNVNLEEELHEIYLLLKEQAKRKGIVLSFSLIESDIVNVRLDINKFKQILFNVVGNAIKYTDRGEVVLRIEQSSNNKDCLLIRVKDTGIGIEADVIPKLFYEFERGRGAIQDKYIGTGLGLAITKKLVDRLGGTILIESVVNVGTEVTIEIPFKKSDVIVSNLYDIKNITLPFLQDKCILIADDEEYNRILLKTLLIKHGPKIIEAVDGKEAVAFIRNNDVDLIIMDVRMPEMNGIDATQEIRKFDKRVPILGATAVMNDDKISRCKAAGMNDVIFKPFTLEELAEKLNTLFKQNGIRGEHRTSGSINLKALNNDDIGNEDIQSELIAIFYKSLNSTCEEINKAYQLGNFKKVSECAHKLIPSCKHFEATKMVEVLKILERNGEGGAINMNEYSKAMEILNQEVIIINKQLVPLLK